MKYPLLSVVSIIILTTSPLCPAATHMATRSVLTASDGGGIAGHSYNCLCCASNVVEVPNIPLSSSLAAPEPEPYDGPQANLAMSFNIIVNFQGGLTASQQAVFSAAEAMWESKILGYPDGTGFVSGFTGIEIDAQGVAIDGVGGTLGSAGPTATWTSGSTYTYTGSMSFDSADLSNMESNGTLQAVIEHEMGHVLGLGTLWGANGVYVNDSGEFTGTNALAKYQTEFGQAAATFVPVELGGGAGTENGHWNEVDGGAAATGITDGTSNDMRDELMTGWIGSSTFVSEMTVASFADLGYVVIPEPHSATLILMSLGLLWQRKRRVA